MASSKKISRGWEHFDHGADIGIRGFGPTPETAFEEAAKAMTAVITELQSVHEIDSVTIECEAPDLEALFFDWLNALVLEMATRGMLFRRFAVRIMGNRLIATAWGEAVARSRHQPAAEVKGPTYTRLDVRENDAGRWTAQCVVDV